MRPPIARIAGVFYTPSASAVRAAQPQARAQVATAVASVALIASAADARPAGAALALALLREQRSACGLVCLWRPGGQRGLEWHAPATPAARRLAAQLAVRGQPARAGGRLVFVELPQDECEAASVASRAVAAAGAAPAVLVLGGPRRDALAELAHAQDALIVAAAPAQDGALERLALAGVAVGAADGAPSPIAWRWHARGLTRALACAGILATPSLQVPARRALEGL